jgi:hypothetical protein
MESLAKYYSKNANANSNNPGIEKDLAEISNIGIVKIQTFQSKRIIVACDYSKTSLDAIEKKVKENYSYFNGQITKDYFDENKNLNENGKRFVRDFYLVSINDDKISSATNVIKGKTLESLNAQSPLILKMKIWEDLNAKKKLISDDFPIRNWPMGASLTGRHDIYFFSDDNALLGKFSRNKMGKIRTSFCNKITELKKKIIEEINNSDDLHLSFSLVHTAEDKNGRLVRIGNTVLSDDSKTFSDYNILPDDIIQISAYSKSEGKKCCGAMFVKTLIGSTITIYGEPYMTVKEMKEMIKDKTGFPLSQQRLIFAGNQMLNYNMRCHYKIKKEDTIHMVLRLRGGMMNETSGRAGNYKTLMSNMFLVMDDDTKIDIVEI